MKTISESLIRVGNFTSSEIAALMTQGRVEGTLGKPALTYIEEKNMERRLSRSLDSESNARPLTWGQLVEKRVFDLLGMEYQLVSKDTIMHPVHNFWAGSPDANKFDDPTSWGKNETVVDIKSPIMLKSFCQLVAPIYEGLTGLDAINHIRKNHKDGEKYYQQLVSNSILTNSMFAELIVYCPYKSELQAIRDMVAMIDDERQKNYYWIAQAADSELPWLLDGGYYKNLNVIRFQVPEEDKIALEARVVECGEQLIKI